MLEKFLKRRLFLIAAVAILVLAVALGFGSRSVRAAPVQIASSVPAPEAGTADSLDFPVGGNQEWIGFYGNLTIQIVLANSTENYSLFNVTADNGTVYITNAGEDPNFASQAAATDEPDTDFNFSLAGEYRTYNMGFNSTGLEACGVANIWYVNTTDKIPVGLLKDSSGATNNYYLCSKVIPQNAATSSIHTDYQYAIIAPKTATYGNSGYDLYYDGLTA